MYLAHHINFCFLRTLFILLPVRYLLPLLSLYYSLFQHFHSCLTVMKTVFLNTGYKLELLRAPPPENSHLGSLGWGPGISVTGNHCPKLYFSNFKMQRSHLWVLVKMKIRIQEGWVGPGCCISNEPRACHASSSQTTLQVSGS